MTARVRVGGIPPSTASRRLKRPDRLLEAAAEHQGQWVSLNVTTTAQAKRRVWLYRSMGWEAHSHLERDGTYMVWVRKP